MLLVDAANVVGSRPDGWWRDRAAAACSLHQRLRQAVDEGRLPAPVVVVFEGRARGGVAEGDAGGVRVVHATGSGDDMLVTVAAQATEPVTLVSADRELGDRIRRLGGDTVGPSWLLSRTAG